MKRAAVSRIRALLGLRKGRELWGNAGEYYSVDGYHLRNGARDAIGDEG